MHRANIEHIIEHGTIKQMVELKDVLVEIIDYLKVEDYDKYLAVEYKLHYIAHGGHLGEKLAKHWVANMVNRDGTCGGHWTKEQTSQVMKDKSLKFDADDFYAVMNMVYSDFYNGKMDLTAYIDLARNWLEDEDASECKLLKYYYFIVCKK